VKWRLYLLFPRANSSGTSRSLIASFQRATSPGKSRPHLHLPAGEITGEVEILPLPLSGRPFIFSVPRVNVSGQVETFFFPRVKSPGKLRPSNSSLPAGHILFLAGEIAVDVDIFNFLLLARPTPRG
jgi:hypothetical protein